MKNIYSSSGNVPASSAGGKRRQVTFVCRKQWLVRLIQAWELSQTTDCAYLCVPITTETESFLYMEWASASSTGCTA